MTRTRYTIDAETGVLSDRDGNSLGRLTSLRLDFGGRGVRGVRGSLTVDPSITLESNNEKSTNRKEGGTGETQRPTATQIERQAIERIWAYYLQLIPSRRVLDTKRTRVIRNALHTMRAAQDCDLAAAEELVKQAILGLSRNPWHNRENPDRKAYLELHYALRGKGDESDDTRIEKAITWGATHSPNTIMVDEEKVQRWLDEVRYYLGKQAADPRATSGRDRAIEAHRKLTTAGFQVIRLDRPPYARLSR